MTDQLDIDGLRAETPGCAIAAHFNNASASLPTNSTLAAVSDHLQREALYGGTKAADEAVDHLKTVRADATGLLGATTPEIAFTTSGSSGFGLVFAALPRLNRDDRILVARHEWGGNLATMKLGADHAGATIEVIPCREDGSVDPDALTAMIDDRVRLVSLTWLPANGGLINDAVALGKICRAAGVPYFVDAGQAIGQVPVDVTAIGCDMLTGTARKFLRGPRGTGLLYVRADFLDRLTPAFLDQQSGPWVGDGPVLCKDARLFETAEGSVALKLGLGSAIKQAKTIGIDLIRQRIQFLSDNLRARLAEISGVTLHDLGGAERSGLVSFTIADFSAQEVQTRLAEAHLNVGANGVPYTPFDMAARGLREIVRASVSYYNTEDEIDRLAATVGTLARRP